MSAYRVSSYTSPKCNFQITIPFFLRMKDFFFKLKKSYILDVEDK